MIYRIAFSCDEVNRFRRVFEADSDATFLDLHKALLESVDYPDDQMTSFFTCNDRWEKEQEVITDRLNEFEQQMHYDYIEGFEALIADLHAHGVKTAVVTSSNMPKMESVYLHQPDFKTLFDAILTSEDFELSKPDPDCYLKAAQRFGSQIDECIVFEDSINGLRSGRAAKMKVVGLTTTNPKEAISALSDIQISDYQNISFDTLESLLTSHKS